MPVARQYELVYIVKPTASDEAVAVLHAQIESIVARFNGRLDKTENWGRRKLAYEIQRYREGIYVLEIITGAGDLIAELDRRLRVVDDVLRHLVVRVDADLRVATRTKARRDRNRQRRRLARGLPADAGPPRQVPPARDVGGPDQPAAHQAEGGTHE